MLKGFPDNIVKCMLVFTEAEPLGNQHSPWLKVVAFMENTGHYLLYSGQPLVI